MLVAVSLNERKVLLRYNALMLCSRRYNVPISSDVLETERGPTKV